MANGNDDEDQKQKDAIAALTSPNVTTGGGGQVYIPGVGFSGQPQIPANAPSNGASAIPDARLQTIDLPSGGTATVPQSSGATLSDLAASRITPQQISLDDAAQQQAARSSAANTGVAQPQGLQAQPAFSTPTTNDLIDSAIAAKQNIQARRADLMAQITGGSYGNVNYGPRSKQQQRQISQQLTGLQQEEQAASQQERYGRAQLHSDTQEAIKSHADQMHTNTQNDVINFYKDVGQLTSAPGTPQHLQDMLTVAGNHPLAAGTTQVRKDLGTYAMIHDDAAARAAAKQAALSTAPVPAGVLQTAARLQGDILQHQAASEQEKAANIAANKPNQPYSKSAQLSATQSQLAQLTRPYPQLNTAQPSPTPAIVPAQQQTQVATRPQAIPAAAISYLEQNPTTRAQFESKFGVSANDYLK
jgi:hypothetical protein